MMVDSDRERLPWLLLADFLLMVEKGTKIENELLPLYIIITEQSWIDERLVEKYQEESLLMEERWDRRAFGWGPMMEI